MPTLDFEMDAAYVEYDILEGLFTDEEIARLDYVVVEVEYEVEGSYYRGGLYDPPEHPYPVVQSVRLDGRLVREEDEDRVLEDSGWEKHL